MTKSEFAISIKKLSTIFEAPNKPHFSNELFAVLRDEMTDPQLQAVTKHLLLTFKPSFGHNFPIPSDFLLALESIAKKQTQKPDEVQSEAYILQCKQAEEDRILAIIRALPKEEYNAILGKAEAEVTSSLNLCAPWMAAAMKSIKPAAVKGRMIEIYRQRFGYPQNTPQPNSSVEQIRGSGQF